MPQPASAQGGFPNCPFHTWSVGSRLGWAEAIARHGSPAMDATMLEHIRIAGLHVERAHALCAQNPAPWPAWQNWREIQGQLAQRVNEFQRGPINRGQLAVAIAAIHQTLASQLAFRTLGTVTERDRTCGELYVRLGAALGFVQTTTQIHRQLVQDSTDRLNQARSLIVLMRSLKPDCRDFTGLLPGIDEALRNPHDARIVQRLDDAWTRGGQAAAPPGAVANPLAPNSPTAGLVVDGEYVDCVFHLWATGSRLGWAEAIARHGPPAIDATMFEHIRIAGLHAERANATCAQNPAPWPAWQTWREIQGQLAQRVNEFQRGLINRSQLAVALAAMHQTLASQLAFRTLGTTTERATTCGELYVRLGAALGFAQTTTQIFRRLTPDAADHLRLARSLILQLRELRPPCHDFTGLIPAIDEALNHANDPSVVGHVDDAWRLGSIVAAPPGASAPATPPAPPPAPPRPAETTPPPRPAETALRVSGGLDPATVQRHVNHILNDLHYRQASYTAPSVTLDILPPAAAGQRSQGRISPTQLVFERHLLHPPRRAADFEEWWRVTVTLSSGEGNADRLEGPASAVEEYRSSEGRQARTDYANQRWYALKQSDGSYLLGMPGITDGVPFRLRPASP